MGKYLKSYKKLENKALFKKSLNNYKASKNSSNKGNAHKFREKKISIDKSTFCPKTNGIKSAREMLIMKGAKI